MKFDLLSYLNQNYLHLIAAKIIREKLVNNDDELHKLMEQPEYRHLSCSIKVPLRNAYREFENGWFDVNDFPDIELTFKEKKKKIRKKESLIPEKDVLK